MGRLELVYTCLSNLVKEIHRGGRLELIEGLEHYADPDAIFRSKAGKSHRGYAANITETVDENGSLITDYQYDVNTRSDVDFLSEAEAEDSFDHHFSRSP